MALARWARSAALVLCSATLWPITGPGTPPAVSATGARLLLQVTPSGPILGGARVTFQVKGPARTPVSLRLRYENGTQTVLPGTTNAQGNLAVQYRVPLHVYLGTVRVRARTLSAGHALTAHAVFQVPATIFITNAEILRYDGTALVPASTATLGKTLRFQVSIEWQEESGIYLPPGGFHGGTLTVRQGNTVIYRSAMMGGGANTTFVYAVARFTDAAEVGPLTARIVFGHDHRNIAFTLTSGAEYVRGMFVCRGWCAGET